MQLKPPADASDFLMVFYRASSIKIRAQIRRANLIFLGVNHNDLRKEVLDDGFTNGNGGA